MGLNKRLSLLALDLDPAHQQLLDLASVPILGHQQFLALAQSHQQLLVLWHHHSVRYWYVDSRLVILSSLMWNCNPKLV